MTLKELSRLKVFHYSIYLFCFTIPFDHRFSNNFLILSAGLWLVALPEIDLSSYWRKYKYYILLFSSLFLINLVGLIHNDNQATAINKLGVRYVYMLAPLIVLLSNFGTEQVRKACSWFCAGIVASSLICIAINLSIYSNSADASLSHLLTYRPLLAPLDLHPNFYSIYVSFAVLFVLHEVAFRKQSNPIRIGLAVLIVYLLTLDLLIQSRAPITALFIVLFLGLGYWLINFQHLRSKTVIFFALAIVMFVIGFASTEKIRGRFVISVNDIEENMFKPDSSLYTTSSLQTVSTILHLRSWYCATESLSDYHFFTGYGAGDEKDVLTECYKSHQWTEMAAEQFSAHNEYLSAFLRHGLTEFLLLLSVLLLPLYLAIKTKNTLYAAFLLLWMLVLFFCTLNRQSALLYYTIFNAMFFKEMLDNYKK